MQATRLWISSVEITWLTGSWTVEPGQHVGHRRLALLARGGGRLAERHVRVERRVLVARRGLDRGDDLARDAELREVAEARLPLGAVVPDRLVEADQALLDQVVRVAADQEVRRGLEPHEPVVAAHEAVRRPRSRPAWRARPGTRRRAGTSDLRRGGLCRGAGPETRRREPARRRRGCVPVCCCTRCPAGGGNGHCNLLTPRPRRVASNRRWRATSPGAPSLDDLEAQASPDFKVEPKPQVQL